MDIQALAARVADTFEASTDTADKTSSPVPGVWLFRRTAPTQLDAAVYDPIICLILQGHKELRFRDESLFVHPGQSLLVSHDVPVQARIAEASEDKPYLSMVVRLDLAVIRSLYEEVSQALDTRVPARSTEVHEADPALVAALARTLDLSSDPVERQVMVPMLTREIHFRLLMAPHGGMLRQLIRHDSQASQVSRAIRRIRDHYREPLAIPDLAREVGMSVSSFHKYFRDITARTPLQYQKELRLLEARELLVGGQHAVTAVAYEVGYGSPNQFSREYARKFGVPPRAHLAKASSGNTAAVGARSGPLR